MGGKENSHQLGQQDHERCKYCSLAPHVLALAYQHLPIPSQIGPDPKPQSSLLSKPCLQLECIIRPPTSVQAASPY